MRKIYWAFISLLLSFGSLAQNKQTVSLEDIWQDYRFYPRTLQGLNWTKNGDFYTSQEGNYIIKYQTLTAQPVDTLYGKEGKPERYLEFDNYYLSPAEDQLLLEVNREGIYRRSSKAYYYVYHLVKNELKPISEGNKISYATFSPDGSKVAYVQANNLFYYDLKSEKTVDITNDGKFNEIINGAADWVYEEEFGFAKAFFWSPDSRKIAFYRFDESRVKEYNMQIWTGGLYPEDYRFKYPKAGEENAQIDILFYDLDRQKTQAVALGEEEDIYIPRIKWTRDANLLSVRKLNRLQNKLELLHADATTGKTQTILTESSQAYVDVEFTDDLYYLQDAKHFLHSSERSGFKHLYLYDMEGKLKRQITSGAWEVSKVLGVDEKAKCIYFTSTEVSPLEQHLYRVDLKGRKKVKLSQESGTHTPEFSPDFKVYLDYFSAADTPPQVRLHESKTGKLQKVLVDNAELQNTLKNYQISPKEFITIETEAAKLNAWVIKPPNFDPQKRYPLVMFVYGGPGSQTVANAWDSFNFFWYQVLADKGYIVVSVDNRGTGGRGAAFRQATYAQLGKLESEDQIAAAQYFAQQSYVDADRIGIWGWSYGGYLSSLCLMLGADTFTAGIAVAPVTSWRFYDTIYTERYLKRPQDNPEGYDQYSPLSHTNKLKGSFLLVHGTSDDNVHFQNALALQNSLIRSGKHFESFFYPNRNHGIYGGNTRLHLYQMMTNFWEKNL